MARRVVTTDAKPVVIVWNEAPGGRGRRIHASDETREILAKLAEVVLAGARRRALVRTGTMRAEMTWKLRQDEAGTYVDIISPATNPKSGFPYPAIHEGKRVRDRRPHRSLRPALRDIRKILAK